MINPKMNLLLLFTFLISFQTNIYAQEVDAYSDIPNGYHITVEYDELTSNSWNAEVTVRVYNAKNRVLIQVKSDIGSYSKKDIKSNFNSQTEILYEDFNFDGISDFGIFMGLLGNNGVPYYQIYLNENGNFIHYEEFSELTMNHLRVDKKRKLLIVTSGNSVKSRIISEYSVKSNHIQLRQQRTRTTDLYPFAKFSTIDYDSDGNKVDESFEVKYNFNDDANKSPNAFFEVDLKNDENKKIILVDIGSTLHFGLVDKNSSSVSLFHPNLQIKPSFKNRYESGYGKFKLEIDNNTTSLRFPINTKQYVLRQTEKDGQIIKVELLVIGINGTKKYYGNTDAVVGNINSILTKGYVNVKIEKRKHEAETEAKRKAIEGAKRKAGGKFKNKPGGGTTDSGADIAGRRVSNRPQPPTNPGVNGNVVIKICIDNNGNVISANFTQKGSAITSAAAIQVAVANAKKWKFNTDAMAPDKQCGTIRYNYKN